MYSSKPISVPIVPQTAVMENPEGKYVYTLDKNNIAQITNIKISGQYKDNWIAQSGLKKGDRIIINGLQKVIPDQPVKVVDKLSESPKVKNKHNFELISKIKRKIKHLLKK